MGPTASCSTCRYLEAVMQIYCLKLGGLCLLCAMGICYGIGALPFHGKQRWRQARTGVLIGCGHGQRSQAGLPTCSSS